MSSEHPVVIDFKHSLVRKAEKAYQCRDLEGLIAAIDEITQFEDPSLGVLERRELDRLTVLMVTMAAEAHLDDLDFETCFRLCGQAIAVLENSSREFQEAGLKPRPSSLLWVGIITVLADAKWKFIHDTHNTCMSFSQSVDRYAHATELVCAKSRSCDLPEVQVQHRIHALLWCGSMLLKQSRRFEPDRQYQIADLMRLADQNSLTNDNWPYFWDQQVSDLLFSGQANSRALRYLYNKRRKTLTHLYLDPFELSAYDASAEKEIQYLCSHPLFTGCSSD